MPAAHPQTITSNTRLVHRDTHIWPCSSALLQRYFSAKEQYFSLIRNQHRSNFSETNMAYALGPKPSVQHWPTWHDTHVTQQDLKRLCRHVCITNHKTNNLLLLVGDTRVLYEIILEFRHLEYRRSAKNLGEFFPTPTKICRAMSGLRSKGLTHPTNALVEVIMSHYVWLIPSSKDTWGLLVGVLGWMLRPGNNIQP
jgi:hypothetical protein